MALIDRGAENLMVIMLIVFFICVVLKFLMYYLLRAEQGFSSAIETRTHRYLNNEYEESKSITRFHNLVEFILKKAFAETYVSRRKQHRKRKGDPSAAVLSKAFMVEVAAQNLIDDTLKQTRYHDSGNTPDFNDLAKYVFRSNPYFNRLWGLIPIGLANSVFAILPSLFIIGGIFGTFLGISKGLPSLKTIDPGNLLAAQATLETFLESMTFAMYSSVVGIFLSVCFTVLNTLMSYNGVYINLVDKFINSLDLMWKETNSKVDHTAVAA
jgi:hypothetical protein